MTRNALNFNIRDAYPNMGLIDTRTQVQPESYDMRAIDEAEHESRETVQAETDAGVTKGSILKVLGGGVLILIVLSALN